jgi:hypothetical protein
MVFFVRRLSRGGADLAAAAPHHGESWGDVDRRAAAAAERAQALRAALEGATARRCRRGRRHGAPGRQAPPDGGGRPGGARPGRVGTVARRTPATRRTLPGGGAGGGACGPPDVRGAGEARADPRFFTAFPRAVGKRGNVGIDLTRSPRFSRDSWIRRGARTMRRSGSRGQISVILRGMRRGRRRGCGRKYGTST